MGHQDTKDLMDLLEFTRSTEIISESSGLFGCSLAVFELDLLNSKDTDQ